MQYVLSEKEYKALKKAAEETEAQVEKRFIRIGSNADNKNFNDLVDLIIKIRQENFINYSTTYDSFVDLADKLISVKDKGNEARKDIVRNWRQTRAI